MSTIKLQTPVPGPKSKALNARRETAIPRGLGHTIPVYVAKTEGATLEDVDGNRYIDFAGGIGCLNVGHRSPKVLDAIRAQLDRFLHTSVQVTAYESYVRLAERLNTLTPGKFPKKTILVNTGAEAVENAVKIARAHTGRPGIIAFEDAFHGRSMMTMALTSKTHPYKAGFGPFPAEVYRIPYAYCYRCSYSLTYPSCDVFCARHLEDTFKRVVASEDVAAVIAEPVLGEGGFVTPPPEFFPTLIDICHKHGVLFIADEVQTGFGRTGAMFACDRYGIEPDMIVTAKSLGGGLPLAAVTGRAEIMDAPGPGGLGGTFAGNPLACEAALAVLDTFEEQDLIAQSNNIGDYFQRRAREWQQRFPIIGDVRGMGAMQAIELVQSKETRQPAPDETRQITKFCYEHGLITITAGSYGNVIRLLVPLVITREQMDEALEVLEAALQMVCENAALSFRRYNGFSAASARSAVQALQERGKTLMSDTIQKYKDYVMTGFVKAVTPIVIAKASGAVVTDENGKEYLDCFAGISVVNAGHGNPRVIAAAKAQMDKLIHCASYIYHAQPVADLAEKIAHITPRGLTKTFFGNGGAEAIEGAMKLARLYTGKHEFIALNASFHGRSFGALSVTGNQGRKKRGGPYATGVAFAPAPYSYRSQWPNDPEECGRQCARSIEDVIRFATSGDVAAFIAEPVMGEGGIIVPPLNYFREVKKILDQHGILFIADEVQSGFCRTGKMFAIEYYGVEPDILVTAKGIADGFPLSGFTTRPEIAAAYKPGDHLSTFGGNPVSCAAALANIEFMQEENLAARATDTGNYAMAKLKDLQKDNPLIGEVRGLGLMIGVELVKDKKLTPATAEAEAIRDSLLKQGVLVGVGGIFGNVVRFQPPLVITRAQIDRALEAFAAALSSVTETAAV